jgi:hypothetical protein
MIYGSLSNKVLTYGQPVDMPRSIMTSAPFTMTSIMWIIWDAPNALIFRQQTIPYDLIITRIKKDIVLWSHGFKNSDQKAQMILWRNHLSSCTL